MSSALYVVHLHFTNCRPICFVEKVGSFPKCYQPLYLTIWFVPCSVFKNRIFHWKWENTGKNCTYSMILIYVVRDNPACLRLLAMLNLTYMHIEIWGPKNYWLIQANTTKVQHIGDKYILTVLWTFAKIAEILTRLFRYYQRGTNISNACNSVPVHFWA